MCPTSSIPNTRERILTYLQENRVATVSGLSRAWGLTSADIRYHLSALVDEGLAELIPRDPLQPAPRGRPVQRYRLAAQSAPDNFPALVHALLGTFLNQIPESEREPLERALAARLAGSFSPSGPTTQRFNEVVTYLNQHAYRARWEASAGGPRILLRNCPYAAVINEYPRMCVLDLYLLEQLLQFPLQHLARMGMVTGKPPACIFAAA